MLVETGQFSSTNDNSIDPSDSSLLDDNEVNLYMEELIMLIHKTRLIMDR